jgi:putative endonuclease
MKHATALSGRLPFGQRGEQLAARYLVEYHGLEIVALNWRGGKLGEIDIVATDPQAGVVVFVEVKTRRNQQYGSPLEAVTPQKQAKLLALADAYLQQHPQALAQQIRFDVVGVLMPSNGAPPEILHLPNAFDGS